jgi:hypothetical protein
MGALSRSHDYGTIYLSIRRAFYKINVHLEHQRAYKCGCRVCLHLN